MSRPIVELVDAGAEPPAGLDAYLSWQLLPPKPANTPIPAEHQVAADWLTDSSMPVEDVDVATWQATSTAGGSTLGTAGLSPRPA